LFTRTHEQTNELRTNNLKHSNNLAGKGTTFPLKKENVFDSFYAGVFATSRKNSPKGHG
jgi:hypothetical protein